MKKRKKNILDGIDKEILRLLLVKRPLVSSRIAKNVGLTPAAIIPRLNNLKEKGIIRKKESEIIRKFKRDSYGSVIKIKSPVFIKWDLDLK
jgi:DNA-binding Lrp family transcriptional regulator